MKTSQINHFQYNKQYTNEGYFNRVKMYVTEMKKQHVLYSISDFLNPILMSVLNSCSADNDINQWR